MPATHDIPGPVPTYVPQPAVLVPLFLLSVAVMIWRLNRHRGHRWWQLIAGVIACAYGVVVVKETLLPIPLGGTFGAHWSAYINLIPLQNTDFADDMVPNVLMFLPLGTLLGLLARVDGLWRATLIAALLSLSIETIQFITDITVHAGHAADINDLGANTLGGLLGFALLALAMRIPGIAQLLTAATWPARRSAARHPLDPSAERLAPSASRA